MKPITLYFALTLTAVLGAAIADPELPPPQYLVQDTDGNPVRTDVAYYVLPFDWPTGNGGGLILKNRPNEDSRDVVQSSNVSCLGYQVKFHSSFSYVWKSKNIQIEILDPEIPGPVTLYWWLDDFDSDFNGTFVTTKDVDKAGDSFKSFFQVVEVEEGQSGRYKFVFSPQVCSRNIGIFTDANQIRRLAINDNTPYEVKFARVPEPKKFNRPFIALGTSYLL